jgi:hypothetical protein
VWQAVISLPTIAVIASFCHIILAIYNFLGAIR